MTPERGLFGWFRNFAPFGLGGFSTQHISLSLPAWACETGAGIDADFEVSSGRVIAEGDYGELRLQVSAGEARVSGTAQTVKAELSAGSAELDLFDVDEAILEVSAGSMRNVFDGDAPTRVRAEVSAGDLEIELPRADYTVNSEVAAGQLDNRLEPGRGGAAGGQHSIDVEIAAGKVTLRNTR